MLLTIDTRPFEATLREKKGQLAKSEAQLHKATNDAGRYGKLVGNGYVSREAYEQTATEAAALRATVQADKAAVESAALDLSYCTLRAPISGRVGGLKVDKGNMVRSSDTTPIVSIDTLSPIYVTFSVPERHLSLILDRMHAGPVEVDVTPTGGQTEKGLLTLVENSVDTTTGTIQLRATFANENRRLWPGYDAAHPELVSLLTRRAAFQKAVSLWREGRGGEARAVIGPWRDESRKYRLFWWASHLPGACFDLAARLYFALPAVIRRR